MAEKDVCHNESMLGSTKRVGRFIRASCDLKSNIYYLQCLRDLYILHCKRVGFFFRTWMSPTIYITLQTGLIILQFSLKIVFFNRVIRAQQKKPRFLSENDDIRGASHYAYLKNSTFIFSAIVNEPYVVENVSPLTLKLQLFAFQKGVSRHSRLYKKDIL